MKKSSESSVCGSRAGGSGRRTKRRIDLSDVPEASAAQPRSMRGVGRPPIGTSARRLVAIRIDPEVLRWAKREARRRAIGYQTSIDEILTDRAKASA